MVKKTHASKTVRQKTEDVLKKLSRGKDKIVFNFEVVMDTGEEIGVSILFVGQKEGIKMYFRDQYSEMHISEAIQTRYAGLAPSVENMVVA